MGDGVLVYFGYPQAHEDNAERSVRAGLELIGAVNALEAAGVGRVVSGARLGAPAAPQQIPGPAPTWPTRMIDPVKGGGCAAHSRGHFRDTN
jgi:hypothetical protein